MALPDKARWRNWADGLRQEMMTSLTAEVTKTVDVITTETGTLKTEAMLKSLRFWQGCQDGSRPNDVIVAAGFEIEFAIDEKKVHEVTFRLNNTWMKIMQQVRDRKNA